MSSSSLSMCPSSLLLTRSAATQWMSERECKNNERTENSPSENYFKLNCFAFGSIGKICAPKMLLGVCVRMCVCMCLFTRIRYFNFIFIFSSRLIRQSHCSQRRCHRHSFRIIIFRFLLFSGAAKISLFRLLSFISFRFVSVSFSLLFVCAYFIS